jgi:hypothetical protein
MADPRVLVAYRDGLRRVVRAPWVWLGAWLVTLLLAVPLALVVEEMIAGHLGGSLAAGRVAAGVDWAWWQEFQAQATGLGTTFTPAILGFGAVLRNLSDVADNERMPTVVGGVVAAWLVIWSFLAGGILDRYARNRVVGSPGFFTACGGHVWRMLRLGVLALAAYVALFAWVHPLLFEDGLYGWLTGDMASERQAFAIRVLLYLVFLFALTAVNLAIDYARVRMVVEDRRSALFAVAAGGRFVRRHLGGVIGLYLLNSLGFLAVIAAYALVAAQVAATTAAVWPALLVGQGYILLRLLVKLGFYATQVSYFQAALAHASYVAAPAVEWPESPAAEALRGETPASRTASQ